MEPFALTSPPEPVRPRVFTPEELFKLHPYDRANPFLMAGPALISFSGGRTSASMLYQVLQAHGGDLPPHVTVAFANTGKEREETLEFVRDCADHWGVDVAWLEWRPRDVWPGDKLRPDPAGFARVTFDTASRAGEPLEGIIRRRSFTPNSVIRFCTTEAKVRVMKLWALSLGWKHWLNVVGLRGDELPRVMKRLEANLVAKERWTSVMPMFAARQDKAWVMAFWARQNFDLQLRDYEGNCDLCFLKGRAKIMRLMRERPGVEAWWSGLETDYGTFHERYTLAELAGQVASSPMLLDDGADVEDVGDSCGDACDVVDE